MKKLLFFAGVMFLFTSLAITQTTFSPTVMELTCPAEIGYDFGDESLDIPFTVSGKPGAFWLVINTHGKADEIVGVENGFLGWHYVNHIDTTVYVSGRYQRELGDVKITWDGTNSDGEKVPEDTYSYYIWGYDDKTTRQKVTDFVAHGSKWHAPCNIIVEVDEQGMVREKPLIFGTPFGNAADDDITWLRYGTAYKWEVGSNPEDFNNLQTTWMPFYIDKAFRTSYQYGQPVLDLQDNDLFYHICGNYASHTLTVMKWEFISGGDAEQDMEFMGWDTDSEWKTYSKSVSGHEHMATTTKPDGSSPYLYITPCTLHIKDQPFNPLTVVNKEEGELVFDIMLDELYLPDDGNERNEVNVSPDGNYIREGNKIIVPSWMACLQEMIDMTNIFEDPYYKDYIVWQNKNGDFFLDKYFWEDSPTPWSCLGGYTQTYSVNKAVIDANNFPIYFRSNMGTVTNTVLTQDGTGIADISFFGVDQAGYDTESMICDNGSQYDGIYCPPPVVEDVGYSQQHSLSFVTFDSGGGLIVPGEVQPGVEEESQEAYSIEQNAPNPFNPTTTIGFTLAEAGDVTIDVYNVAGQKVDTLMNDFMEAGSHSVVWDASGFSAGVYFYTIKAGNFTRTMKMTLLK